MKWTRDVRPKGIGLHSALLWSERQRLGVALVASIVTHGFALALTPIVQLEPQALPEVLQVELVALAAPSEPAQPEPAPAPPEGARGPAPAEPVPEAAPPEPVLPQQPEPLIEVEPPKPKPARAEKKPKPASKPPERVDRAPSPPPEPAPAETVVAQREPSAEVQPAPSPQEPAPEPPVQTAPPSEPQQLALAPPSRQAALEEYRRAVSKLVVRDRRYPHIARARGWEGTVNVAVRIGPGQTVHEITIERSSGFKVLDAEALKMVERAQPFPSVPKALGEVVVTVPVSFELRN
jgi:protein TonB